MSGHLFGMYRSLAVHVSAGRRIFVFCQVLYFFVNKRRSFLHTHICVYPLQVRTLRETKWLYSQDSAVHRRANDRLRFYLACVAICNQGVPHL